MSRYVLTAAHCLVPTARNPAVASEVLLGEVDLSQEVDCVSDDAGGRVCAARPQTIPIETVIVHEDYEGRYPHRNDIGLIRLARPARLTNNTHPVCLPVDPGAAAALLAEVANIDRLDGATAKVMGWGRTDFRSNGDVDVRLKVTTADILVQ